jgi:phosphatidylglycerol:prolipoprotein diacylglycerol transferase
MVLPYPDIPHEIFTLPAFTVGGVVIGPFAARWYALGYIAGIVLGWRYAVGLARDARLWGSAGSPISEMQIDDLILWLTVGIIAGGRLGYVLFYMLPLAAGRDTLVHDPLEILRLWHGGMSFHGGFIGVLLAATLFARSRGLPLLSLGDIVAASGPIGIALVRVANFINGELWGRVTHLPWGMVFCGRHIETYADGTCVAGLAPRHPSQLYESALEGVALFLILRLATHRGGWLRRPGAVAGLFLLGYGLFRIALENVRMPDEGLRDLPLGLTMGIILSTPMVVAGGWLIWRGVRAPLAPGAPGAPGARDPA